MRSIRCCLLSPCRLLVLLAVLALGTIGCGPAEHDHVFDITYNPCEPLVIEPEGKVRPAEFASIEQAMAMWNEAASLRLTLEPVANAARVSVRFEEGAGFINGHYSDETGEVTINRSLADARERTITLAHELGHAFGLRHVARQTRRSLMNEGNLKTAVTAGDIEQLRQRWHGCPPVELAEEAAR